MCTVTAKDAGLIALLVVLSVLCFYKFFNAVFRRGYQSFLVRRDKSWSNIGHTLLWCSKAIVVSGQTPALSQHFDMSELNRSDRPRRLMMLLWFLASLVAFMFDVLFYLAIGKIGCL